MVNCSDSTWSLHRTRGKHYINDVRVDVKTKHCGLTNTIICTSSMLLVTFSLTGKPLPCTAVWRSAPYSTATYNEAS
jgi:hypothetical protein